MMVANAVRRLKQAERLRALEPGWDGDGSPKISEAAIQAAMKCLGSVGYLVPMSNGGVQIDFQNAEICFQPDGEQEFDQTDPVVADTRIIRDGIEDRTRCGFCRELNANCDCDDIPGNRYFDGDDE